MRVTCGYMWGMCTHLVCSCKPVGVPCDGHARMCTGESEPRAAVGSHVAPSSPHCLCGSHSPGPHSPPPRVSLNPLRMPHMVPSLNSPRLPRSSRTFNDSVCHPAKGCPVPSSPSSPSNTVAPRPTQQMCMDGPRHVLCKPLTLSVFHRTTVRCILCTCYGA